MFWSCSHVVSNSSSPQVLLIAGQMFPHSAVAGDQGGEKGSSVSCSCGDRPCGEQGGLVGIGGNGSSTGGCNDGKVWVQQPSHGEGMPHRASICSQLIKRCSWPQVRPTIAHTSAHAAAGGAGCGEGGICSSVDETSGSTGGDVSRDRGGKVGGSVGGTVLLQHKLQTP